MKNPFLSEKAGAWQVFVRRAGDGRRWALYTTYDSEKQAEKTMRAIKGPPLEVKVVPLYPMITNGELR